MSTSRILEARTSRQVGTGQGSWDLESIDLTLKSTGKAFNFCAPWVSSAENGVGQWFA